MDFQQKHAIITGGSSGIGKAIAKLLTTRGANVSIVARSPEKLETAKHEIEAVQTSPGQRVATFSADVSDRSQAEAAVNGAIATLGNPDILITCAGIARPGYFQDIPIEVFEETMAINYFGSLYCIRAALPAMQQQKEGSIVLISSGAGLVGIFGYTPYSPSKFALRGLAESLRGELKPLGINLSIAYPPDTDTPQLVEENKTKPPETKQITGSAKTWSAEGVAQAVVEGMEKQVFAIAPGTEMKILSSFHSVLAPLLNRYFDQIVVKTRNTK